MDITQYEPTISKILAKLNIPRGQRDDMMQECYIALLEKQEKTGNAVNPKLVEVICLGRVRDIQRSEGRLRAKEENQIKFVSADLPAVAKNLSKIEITQNRTAQQIHEAIATLRDEDREVMWAIFVEGRSVPEVSGITGLSVSTVRGRKERGIKSLKQYFGKEV